MSDGELKANIAVKEFLDGHLNAIRAKILARARELSGVEQDDLIEPRFIAIAAFEYAPGDQYQYPPEISWYRRALESISGVTLLSAALALVFSLIGAIVVYRGGNGTGYFDTVRLFAGAIVGSAGAAAVTASRVGLPSNLPIQRTPPRRRP